MMYSTTFRQHSVSSRALEAMADTIARGFVRLQSLFSPAQAAPSADEARMQLLQLADSYESSQPSYAADLRAAASRR